MLQSAGTPPFLRNLVVVRQAERVGGPLAVDRK